MTLFPVTFISHKHATLPLRAESPARRCCRRVGFSFPLPAPRFSLLSLVFLLLTAFLHAQSARWDPPGGTLATGKLEELSLIFEGCAPKDDFQPPKTPGLTLVFRGKSQNISMVNFSVTKSVTYTYAARLERKEKVEIPSFDVQTDQGAVRVPVASFSPGEATVGQSSVSIEDVAQSKFQPPALSFWAGEVFPFTYRLDVLRRYFYQLGSHPDWNPAPFVIEEWAKPESADTKRFNEPQISILYRTRAYAKEAGAYTLNTATQLVNIQTGVSGGFLFSQPRYEQIVINSDQPQITIKPLPLPAPAGFDGAVGQFKFTSKVVPDNAKVGEPITWTLELSGTGNWPDIPGLPSRSVSKSFEVIQPQAKRSIAENKLFDGTLNEDVVLMPSKAGSYTLGPVSFSYFDPKSGSYKTITTNPVTVTIQDAMLRGAQVPIIATPEAQTPGSESAAATAASQGQGSGTKGQQVLPPAAPAPLPTDPLSGTNNAFLPLPSRAALALICLPFVALAGLWSFFAAHRALLADPMRPRREAAARLRKTLQALSAPQPKNADCRKLMADILLSWQRDAALMLGITKAAPTADCIDLLARGIPAKPAKRSPDYASWSALWRDADRVLYSAEGSLPPDWQTKAQGLLASTRLPGFPVYTTLAPRHLLPWWFAALLFLCLVAPSSLVAQSETPAPAPELTDADGKPRDPVAAYVGGDFKASAALWRTALSKNPADWRTRHNLGLTLLQQGSSNEAVSQLAVAFVQHPRNETVQDNFLVAMEHAGFAPQSLGAIAQNHPISELARLASPFEWQLILAFAATLAATALGLTLWLGYGSAKPAQAVQVALSTKNGRRTLAVSILCLLSLALVIAGAALSSLHAYGPATDRDAALVWQSTTLHSVPTEADTSHKTSALQAGSLAVVDRSFLGWRHLRFPEGEAGWVRNEDLIYLWK